MLVCNVSQRARRRVIATELEETATAGDASTTGNIVFATLVDDPANVHDTVDAYLGEIMVEAASAAATFAAGLIYVAAIDETTSASASQAVPIIYVGTVAEAAAASSTQDAGTSAAVAKQRALSASRAGLGSTVVDDGSGKTQVISNVGAVS